MRCRWQRMLWRALEDELSPAKRRRWEAHLGQCPRCAAEWRAWQRLRGLTQDWPAVPSPPWLREGIAARVAEHIPQPVSCFEARGLLYRQLDEALSPEQREGLEAHLAQCAACSAYAKEWSGYRAALQQWEPVEPPAFLRSAILARVRALEEAKAPWWVGWQEQVSSWRQRAAAALAPRPAWGWAAAAVGVALLLLRFWGVEKPSLPSIPTPTPVPVARSQATPTPMEPSLPSPAPASAPPLVEPPASPQHLASLPIPPSSKRLPKGLAEETEMARARTAPEARQEGVALSPPSGGASPEPEEVSSLPMIVSSSEAAAALFGALIVKIASPGAESATPPQATIRESAATTTLTVEELPPDRLGMQQENKLPFLSWDYSALLAGDILWDAKQGEQRRSASDERPGAHLFETRGW